MSRRRRFAAALATVVALGGIDAAAMRAADGGATTTVVPGSIDPDAAALLARFKTASGGGAWDAIRALHTHGTLATGGLSGPFDAWEDLATGSSTSRFRLGPVEGAEGFDGDAPWSRDPSGEVTVERATEALEAARDEAYRTALAWWYPERWPASIRMLPAGDEAERHFDRIEITPRGGRPFELWIDHDTALLERAVERGGIDTQVTTFADWRRVSLAGGASVELPFHVRTTNGEARYDTVMRVDAVEVDPAIDAAMFRPPQSRADDFSLAGGATTVTVPFHLRNNHVYVEVAIDGGRPLPMLLDSGGFNVLTPETAKRLGIRGQGALQGRGVGAASTDVALARVRSVRLGPVELRDQVFYLLPLAGVEEVEGTGVAGVLGFELLKRFVVEIDYARERLIVTLPEHFDAARAGVAIPFVFADHMPAIDGSVDGIAGRFTIDTGSRGALALDQPFVAAHDLVKRYRPTIETVTGWGVGGGVRAWVTRAHELRLGRVVVAQPVTELVSSEKGALADPYMAGNVGGGVLRHFRVTFDYRHERLYLAPGADAGAGDDFDRAGLALRPLAGALYVDDVVPGGPAAAAGILPGERIVGGRLLGDDGHAAARGEHGAQRAQDELDLEALRAHLRADSPGTRVELRVRGRAASAERRVTIALFELAAPAEIEAQPATPAPTGQLTPVPPSPQ